MSKLKLGVVGCGVLGSRHAEIYKNLPDVELVAVCDRHLDRAVKLGSDLDAKAFDQLEPLLDVVDAVSVCTPAVEHHSVSKSALNAGLHLLVEKPITTTLPDADELLKIAKERKLILQTGHIERFNGAVSAVKKIVNNPVFIECDRIGFFDPRISDVGVVLDLMIHDIEIILYLVNSPVKTVQAVGMNILSQSEDFANCRIEFESGTVCNLTASRMAQKRLRKIRIFEKNRYISLDYFRQEVLTFNKESAHTSETLYRPLDVRKSNPLEDEIKDFVRCVKHNQEPEVRGEDARAALKVALQILNQIKMHP